MPILDTHISGEQLRTPRQVDAGKPFRQIGALAQDIGGALEERDTAKLEFDTRMQMAEQKNQVDTANINTKNALALWDEEYSAHPLDYKPRDYEDKVTQILQEQGEDIEDPAASIRYQQKAGLLATQYGIKARATRNTAVIAQGKQNTISSLTSIAGQPALDSAGNLSPLKIEARLLEGERVIDEAVAFGYYSEIEGEKLKKEGVTTTALSDASRGSKYAREVMTRLADPKDTTYPFQDPKDKKAAWSQAKGMLGMMEYKEKVTVESDKVQAERISNAIITQDDKSGYQRYVEIKQIGLSKANEDRALAVLNKRLGVASDTNSEAVEELGLDLDYFEKGEGVEPVEYFKQVQGFRAKVDGAYIDGKLSPASYDQLLLDIDKATDIRRSELAGAAKSGESLQFIYDNGEAAASFSSEFDARTSSKLFADYYVRKNAPDFNNTYKNREELVEQIKQEEAAQQRTTAQRIVQQFATRSALRAERDAGKQQLEVGKIYTNANGEQAEFMADGSMRPI
jgi:hypothetical protein